VYTGLESILAPYFLQNLVMSYLSACDSSVEFREWIDCQKAGKSFNRRDEFSRQQLYHLPFWKADVLPDKFFDVILCCHVLDEVGPDDFKSFMQTIKHKLAPEGIVYCRGSQQRAHMEGHHNIDITQSLNEIGLATIYCDINPQLTRVLTPLNSNRFKKSLKICHRFYDNINDQQLCRRMANHAVYISKLEQIIKNDETAVIFGYGTGIEKFISSVAENVKINAIVDDREQNIGKNFNGLKVQSSDALAELEYDRLIITKEIDQNSKTLLNLDAVVPPDRIIKVFDYHPFGHTIDHPIFFANL
jgi:hypothetical protein